MGMDDTADVKAVMGIINIAVASVALSNVKYVF